MAFSISGMLGSIAGRISGTSIKSGLIEVAKWTAFKIFMTALIFTGLYIVLNNFVIGFVGDLMSGAQSALESQAGGGLQAAVVDLTGLGAYLAQKLQLVDAFAVWLTGLAIASIRSFLPF
jgi:hypothetical protein